MGYYGCSSSLIRHNDPFLSEWNKWLPHVSSTSQTLWLSVWYAETSFTVSLMAEKPHRYWNSCLHLPLIDGKFSLLCYHSFQKVFAFFSLDIRARLYCCLCHCQHALQIFKYFLFFHSLYSFQVSTSLLHFFSFLDASFCICFLLLLWNHKARGVLLLY